MFFNKELQNSANTETSAVHLRSVLMNWSEHLNQRVEEGRHNLLSFNWEVFGEHVLQNLSHSVTAAICYDIPIHEHMLDQELLYTFISFRSPRRLVDRVQHPLFECFRQVTKQSSVESECRSIRVLLDDGHISQSLNHNSYHLSILHIVWDQLFTLLPALLLGSYNVNFG